MTYTETVNYLYSQLPVFQHVGASAYKPGLENTLKLAEALGNPHQQFQSIHIAGTNGKGSTAHLLAATLQASGYKTALFTSPHLIDFRERMRVDGAMASRDFVVDFVAQHRPLIEQVRPSFFELTTLMAFSYFASCGVEVAVVECGLGGRLDSTNIITPLLSIITNISLDHTQLLGSTPTEIAFEKGGIIKPHTPIVIGEAEGEVAELFAQIAQRVDAPIHFAQTATPLLEATPQPHGGWCYTTTAYPQLESELGGVYQAKNCVTVLTAIGELQRMGLHIDSEAVRRGFREVTTLTGLQGRWQKVNELPLAICDTGHNTAGIAQVVAQLTAMPHKQLHIVIGMVNDKDVNGVLALLPKGATYYFTAAGIARALPPEELQRQAKLHQIEGVCYPTVAEAYRAALAAAAEDHLIYIGGSNFVVADLLSSLV